MEYIPKELIVNIVSYCTYESIYSLHSVNNMIHNIIKIYFKDVIDLYDACVKISSIVKLVDTPVEQRNVFNNVVRSFNDSKSCIKLKYDIFHNNNLSKADFNDIFTLIETYDSLCNCINSVQNNSLCIKNELDKLYHRKNTYSIYYGNPNNSIILREVSNTYSYMYDSFTYDGHNTETADESKEIIAYYDENTYVSRQLNGFYSKYNNENIEILREYNHIYFIFSEYVNKEVIVLIFINDIYLIIIFIDSTTGNTYVKYQHISNMCINNVLKLYIRVGDQAIYFVCDEYVLIIHRENIYDGYKIYYIHKSVRIYDIGDDYIFYLLHKTTNEYSNILYANGRKRYISNPFFITEKFIISVRKHNNLIEYTIYSKRTNSLVYKFKTHNIIADLKIYERFGEEYCWIGYESMVDCIIKLT